MHLHATLRFLAGGMTLALIALAFIASPTWAQQPARPAGGNIEFKNVVEMEFEVKTPDGKVEKRRGPPKQAIPGTQVIYTSTFTNTGSRPAGNIAINNPIPANTTLVPASALMK